MQRNLLSSSDRGCKFFQFNSTLFYFFKYVLCFSMKDESFRDGFLASEQQGAVYTVILDGRREHIFVAVSVEAGRNCSF